MENETTLRRKTYLLRSIQHKYDPENDVGNITFQDAVLVDAVIQLVAKVDEMERFMLDAGIYQDYEKGDNQNDEAEKDQGCIERIARGARTMFLRRNHSRQ